MKHAHTATLMATLLPVLAVSALTLEVNRFENSMFGDTGNTIDQQLPFGYQEVVQTPIDESLTIKVSEPPYVDYLIPNNQGSAGITAQKMGGAYITGTNAADPGGGFLGANNYPDPDRWHVVFEWTDGLPLPFGSDYWGVSHSGWNGSTSNLITRIELATTEEITVYHWFNDGWNYDNHPLDGHILTVTHYKADGNVVDSATVTLPSSGAELFFGDHRQFYTSVIKVTATGENEFLIISNEAGNIGYKGTAVALLGEEPSGWHGYEMSPEGWVNTGANGWFSGHVWVENDPWIWSVALSEYIYVPDDSGWIYMLSGHPRDGESPWTWSDKLNKYVFVPDDSGWVYPFK